MKLNEIREIVDFMKENGVYELEYSERNTSIRLKMARPAHQRPWERFRGAAPESEAAQGTAQGTEITLEETAEDGLLEMELSEAAEKMRQGAVKAGSAVVDTVKAGASFLKSKRDECLSGGTPGAYDVKLEEEPQEETPQAEEPVPQQEETPCCEPEEDIDLTGEVKLDTDAAREAVSKTAEVVVNTAKAAVELGVAGVRRGSTLLGDWLGLNGEDAPEESVGQEELEESPAKEGEEAGPAAEEEVVEQAPEEEAPAGEEPAQSAEDGEAADENEEIEE